MDKGVKIEISLFRRQNRIHKACVPLDVVWKIDLSEAGMEEGMSRQGGKTSMS